MTRLPPLSESELKRLYDKLVLAGQVVAQTDWRPPQRSVREIVESIARKPQ